MEIIQTIAANAQRALLVAGAIVAGFGVLSTLAACLLSRSTRRPPTTDR